MYLEKRIKKLQTLIKKYDPEWLERVLKSESQPDEQGYNESGITQNRFGQLVAKFEEMDIDDGHEENSDNESTASPQATNTTYNEYGLGDHHS